MYLYCRRCDHFLAFGWTLHRTCHLVDSPIHKPPMMSNVQLCQASFLHLCLHSLKYGNTVTQDKGMVVWGWPLCSMYILTASNCKILQVCFKHVFCMLIPKNNWAPTPQQKAQPSFGLRRWDSTRDLDPRGRFHGRQRPASFALRCWVNWSTWKLCKKLVKPRYLSEHDLQEQ